MSCAENRLAMFFNQIAPCMARHDSTIATAAGKSLIAACTCNAKAPVSKSTCPARLGSLLAQTSSLALRELSKVMHTLPWASSRTKARMHPDLANLTTVELIGPDGVVEFNHIRIGLLYQPEKVAYPNHRHAAEELYFVLSGSALWGQSNQVPTNLPPDSFRYHASWEWHEIITQQVPLLALYCWTGDLRFDQYELNNPG